ncbi:MAG: hypothetical protein QM692_11690 [Thermomicrobiales bacterium]
MAALQPDIVGEWPRLDLVQRHLSALELRWRYPWAEIADVFGDHIYWTGAHSITPYQRSKTRHYLTQSATGLDEFGDADPNMWTIAAVYLTERTLVAPTIPKSAQRGQEFANVASELNPAAPAVIHAHFGFNAPDAAVARVPLPLDYPSPGGAAFDEILGIRGASSGDEAHGIPPYRFTWDVDFFDGHSLLLDYELAAPPLAETAILALNAAIAIAARFVDAPGLHPATSGKRR